MASERVFFSVEIDLRFGFCGGDGVLDLLFRGAGLCGVSYEFFGVFEFRGVVGIVVEP